MRLLLTATLVAWLPRASPGGAFPGGNAVGPYTVGGGAAAGIRPPVGGGGCVGPGCGPDFNPILLGGMRGYPGIRARLNSRMFTYASQLVGELLNKQIQRARLPDITQSTQPKLDGCVVLYNAYVSRYRCPQRVVIFPKPNNKIVLQVQNLDIGVTGNLGGQINVIVPIPLSGIAQINVHGVTVTVEASIEAGPRGPRISICSCSATVNYADVCIENGGLVGSIANSFFRKEISDMVRSALPSEICKMLPKTVDEQINNRAGAIPQAVALTQLAQLAGGSLSSAPPKPSAEFCEKQCGIKQSATTSMTAAAPAADAASVPAAAVVAPQIPQAAYAPPQHAVAARSIAPPPPPQQRISKPVQNLPVASQPQGVPQQQQVVLQQLPPQQIPVQHGVVFVPQPPPVVVLPIPRRAKRATEIVVPRAVAGRTTDREIRGHLPRRAERRYSPTAKIVRTGRGAAGVPQALAAPVALKVQAPQQSPASSYLCSQCSVASDDPAGFIRDLAQNLNLAKLNDMFLSVQLMNTYATTNDFTVDLTGEFSPGGQGGTPFGPFPTMFPAPYDDHMVEAIVSDYTVNSLFYWMHKKGFLSFRIGPETPRIGELLKTSCSDDEDDELEDHGVELDTEEARRKKKLKRRHLRHLLQARHKREVSVLEVEVERVKRQDAAAAGGDDLGGGSLSDLGICFGDILPAVREKYPNKKIAIQIHTIRAPSIILSRLKGGSATIDLSADADIFIDGTQIKVGTITILAQVTIALQIRGNRIYGMGEITSLKLLDNSGSLGLPQDALDNLGTLGKELLTKLANDALAKGIPLNLTQSPNLPITFYNPTVMIVEHGLYIAGDLTISPAILGTLAGSGSCYRF